MPQIVPAILEKTAKDFFDKISQVADLSVSGLQRIQVDFGDGLFISNTMLSVTEMAGLKPTLHWEAHLMIKEPMDFVNYKLCGFETIVVHYEAYPNRQVLESGLIAIKSLGMKAGVAINPETPVAVLKELENRAEQFLVMSVVPGKQGQEFIPQTIEKIQALKQLLPQSLIEVDGGVNVGNIKSVAMAGADFICVGSALVRALNVSEAFEQLQGEINK